ncbi:MAG: hypothetical protein JJT76_09545 [Clostridiaceae bacterium]|nr:hypothetical protein [Clostridiaceae bacterium]
MKKFQLKELLVMAIVVATIFVLGYMLLPIMHLMPLPAYRALVVAPIYAIGVTLVTKKIKKLGSVTLLGLLIGTLLSSFFIWMFFIAFLAGVLTDLSTFLTFKGYKSNRSIEVASGIFPSIQLPLTFWMAAYTIGGASGELLKHPLVISIPTIITFVLGYFTSKKLNQLAIIKKL